MPKLLDIIKYPDQFLNKQTDDVLVFDEWFKWLPENMIHTMYYNNGVGLAGNQVGRLFSVVVMDYQNSPLVLINPKIVAHDPLTTKSEEACLSIPGVSIKLSCRYSWVDVVAQDIEGNEFTKGFRGKSAIIVQHEMDHLIGKTILDRAGYAAREMLKKKLK